MSTHVAEMNTAIHPPRKDSRESNFQAAELSVHSPHPRISMLDLLVLVNFGASVDLCVVNDTPPVTLYHSYLDVEVISIIY